VVAAEQVQQLRALGVQEGAVLALLELATQLLARLILEVEAAVQETPLAAVAMAVQAALA